MNALITAGKAALIQSNNELNFYIPDINYFQSSCKNHEIIFNELNETSDKPTSYAYQIFQCLANYARFKFPNIEDRYTKLGRYYSNTLHAEKDTIYLELHDFIRNKKFSSPKAAKVIEIAFNALLSHRKPELTDVILLSQYSKNLTVLATKLYSRNSYSFSQDNIKFAKQIQNLVVNFINIYPLCIILNGNTKTNTILNESTYKKIQIELYNVLRQLRPAQKTNDLNNLSLELTDLLGNIYTNNSAIFRQAEATTISCINLLVNLYLKGNSKSVILSSFSNPIPEHILFDKKNWNQIFDTKKAQLLQEMVPTLRGHRHQQSSTRLFNCTSQISQSTTESPSSSSSQSSFPLPEHSQQRPRNKPAHDRHRLLRSAHQMSHPIIGTPIEPTSNSTNGANSIPKNKS